MVIITTVDSYNVAEAKAHLSEILERVLDGQEVLLTKRGKPVARVIPVERISDILGAGKEDPNINLDVLTEDTWWKPLTDEEAKLWYE
jgi:prevent-host-death family protein